MNGNAGHNGGHMPGNLEIHDHILGVSNANMHHGHQEHNDVQVLNMSSPPVSSEEHHHFNMANGYHPNHFGPQGLPTSLPPGPPPPWVETGRDAADDPNGSVGGEDWEATEHLDERGQRVNLKNSKVNKHENKNNEVSVKLETETPLHHSETSAPFETLMPPPPGLETSSGTNPVAGDSALVQSLTDLGGPGGLGQTNVRVGEDGLANNKKSSSRRNAWGNLSYADLITQAIQSSADQRLTLSQVYEWMVQNIPYFKDKGDSNSSAGWKVRHLNEKC